MCVPTHLCCIQHPLTHSIPFSGRESSVTRIRACALALAPSMQHAPRLTCHCQCQQSTTLCKKLGLVSRAVPLATGLIRRQTPIAAHRHHSQQQQQPPATSDITRLETSRTEQLHLLLQAGQVPTSFEAPKQFRDQACVQDLETVRPFF